MKQENQSKNNRKQFDNVDVVYEELMPKLVNYAKQQLIRKDEAIDVVHEAFVKALEYKSRKPDAFLSEFLLFKETKKACNKHNRVILGTVSIRDNYEQIEEITS